MVPILKVVHPSRYCPAAAQEHISDIHKCSAYELSPFRPLCKLQILLERYAYSEISGTSILI